MNVLSDWSVRNRTGAAFGTRLLLLMILGVLHATGHLNVQSNRLKGVIESFLYEMATI